MIERQNMNTADEVINDLAIQLANKAIECADYKLYTKKRKRDFHNYKQKRSKGY